MHERRVGRPPKGEAEVGKQGLIRMTRQRMRERCFDIFLRKELAHVCGVTPALITYYFKNTNEIFEAIIAETIEKHYNNLHRIARSNLEPALKYRRAVTSIVEAFAEDINLFETFEHAVALGLCRTPDYVDMMQQELKLVLQECFHLGMPHVFGREVFHGAVWGVCIAAAANPTETPLFPGTFLDVGDLAKPFGANPKNAGLLNHRSAGLSPNRDLGRLQRASDAA